MDEYITLGELLLLLAVYAGPVVLAAAALAWVSLPPTRRQPPCSRQTMTLLAGAALGALPLTLGVWLLMGLLPARIVRWVPQPDILGIGAAVVAPALVAAVLVFAPAAWLLRRRTRAAT